MMRLDATELKRGDVDLDGAVIADVKVSVWPHVLVTYADGRKVSKKGEVKISRRPTPMMIEATGREHYLIREAVWLAYYERMRKATRYKVGNDHKHRTEAEEYRRLAERLERELRELP